MKIISRIFWSVVFIVIFGIALKNMQEVVLHLYLGYEIKGPLVLVLFSILGAGFAMGVLAMTPTFFRQRRDLSKQKKTIASIQSETEASRQIRVQPPQPDSVVNQ
jgi:uncharacterized integral membrane protein